MKRAYRLVVLLTLTVLGVLPSAATSPILANTVAQYLPTWSPFGPQEKQLTITDFSDPTTMQNAFLNGQIDIADSPAQPVPPISSNPDAYLTPPITQLLVYQLDINHPQPFLGVAMQKARSTSSSTIVTPIATGVGNCGTGFGQLTINLQNQEQGNTTILDAQNRLTISNQPSGQPTISAQDSGGSAPNGNYVFPCILAGTYGISSSLYNATAPCSTTSPTSCLFIGSNMSVTATLRVNWNSPSTKQETTAGVSIMRALAHLIDKPSFIQGQSLQGNAIFDDQQVSPSQNIPNLFPLTAECVDHPWFSPCNPVSAYNFVGDSIGGGSEWWTLQGQNVGATSGYSGYADLRAACDNFVRAGFVVVNGANSTDCGDVALASAGTSAPLSYAHLSNNGKQILFAVRTPAARRAFGQIMADSLNFLFGTPNNGQTIPNQTPQCTVLYGTSTTLPTCAPHYITINQSFCIFQSGISLPPNSSCSWNLYTGGSSVGPNGEDLYLFYHSSFSLVSCGGPAQPFSNNYGSYCDPEFDTLASGGEAASSISQSIPLFARAATAAALNGMTVPVYSPVSLFYALNGWSFVQCVLPRCAHTQSSLVPVQGQGWGDGAGYWSLLNMRQVPGYAPVNAQYAPGGGNPDLIRRGFSQDTYNLSPFQAVNVNELEIVGLLFDSMLQVNPLNAGGTEQVIDWQTSSHSSSYNPSEVSCNILGCVTGTTTQTWHLRNGLTFQDGTLVTANDVAYTLTAYRDVSSATYQPYVANMASATAIDKFTVQVKLMSQSVFYETDIGLLPIIPKHLWAPYCGDPPSPTSQCANPVFDPMNSGIMIGGGPWVCAVPAGYPNAGHVGGSCVTSPSCPTCLDGQLTSTGDKFILTRNAQFVRCCPGDPSSPLYAFSWADKTNDGLVNIVDVADAAQHFCTSPPCTGFSPGADPYWSNSRFTCPGDTWVDICSISTVAGYFGNGLTTPYLASQVTAVDPQIDPFFCPNSGC